MINAQFLEKERELQEKYDRAVRDIANANGVDMKIGWLMLMQNVRNKQDDLPRYIGAPYVEYYELEKDLEELDKLRRV